MIQPNQVRATIKLATADHKLSAIRFQLAIFSAKTFDQAGEELQLLGRFLGSDRKMGVSPFGNGSDAAVAVSTLLKIGSQLISASSDLFHDGRSYAAAALLRQLVEVEYLAWAMEANHDEAERWLRSDKNERMNFFTPAKLRKASTGKFHSKDYGHHCELGGHPSPAASKLLAGDIQQSQLLLSDLLGHTGRIWEHLVCWADGKLHGEPILSRTPTMRSEFLVWKSQDPLICLPPAP